MVMRFLLAMLAILLIMGLWLGRDIFFTPAYAVIIILSAFSALVIVGVLAILDIVFDRTVLFLRSRKP